MPQPRISLKNIVGQGWTYCPRCNQETLVPDGAGGWHCPICDIKMAITPPVPQVEILLWSEALNQEETEREFQYIRGSVMAHAAEQAKRVPPKLCKRVRACLSLLTALAWLFGCKPIAVVDKKHKEATK